MSLKQIAKVLLIKVQECMGQLTNSNKIFSHRGGVSSKINVNNKMYIIEPVFNEIKITVKKR